MIPRAQVWSLCDRSLRALEPWAEAGFTCAAVDTLPGDFAALARLPNVTHIQTDVRTLRDLPGALIVFGWPPCTHLAGSGARHWAGKGPEALRDALSIVEAVRALAARAGAPLLIENPVGRLSTHWRQPDGIFHPYQFAGFSGPEDNYTKKTCLWAEGGAKLPALAPRHEREREYRLGY